LEFRDEYKTIAKVSSETIFKDKGSKFLGYAFPISTEEEVASIIQDLKELHHKARHWCFAWRLGVESVSYRLNDDGEPNNSAGQPIYGQILSHELTNVLVVVVRYFGGTKLGIGGLINAYRTSANLALESSEIIQKTIDTYFIIEFDYVYMNKIMRLIKDENIKINHQNMEMFCNFGISIRKNEAEKIKNKFEELRCVRFIKID